LPISGQPLAGARFDVGNRLQLCQFRFEFLIHRHMHVAVKLDQISEHKQSALDALDELKLGG
jgi:hypothetical protein